MNLIKRLLFYYHIHIISAVAFTTIAFMFVYDYDALLSAMARKIALASIGLLYYYITRFIIIGHIEWKDPYDKIYSFVLLIYMAIVISFG